MKTKISKKEKKMIDYQIEYQSADAERRVELDTLIKRLSNKNIKREVELGIGYDE